MLPFGSYFIFVLACLSTIYSQYLQADFFYSQFDSCIIGLIQYILWALVKDLHNFCPYRNADSQNEYIPKFCHLVKECQL